MTLDQLKNFRQSAYTLLGKGRDATMDLMDAVLVTRSLHSFAELSLSPVFRRKWPSLYEALEDVRPSRRGLMKLSTRQMPGAGRVLLAGDHTAWPRLYARTLKDRTYEHEAKTLGGKPITVGHGYSTLAWIPEKGESWALPLCHERITSYETPLTRAAFQLKQVCRHLKVRPLSVWDSEYGCASFVKMTADIAADQILRLRPNRCLWMSPPPPDGKKGRPKKHGEKFKLSDPTTHKRPEESLFLDDPTLGVVELNCWHDLHFRETPDIPMMLVRIQRKGRGANAEAFKPLWLACLLLKPLSLEEIWRAYQQRFGVDHWNRFVKQRLHWTLPQLSTDEACRRWSELMPLLTWQLWLARSAVTDNPLPWQKPQVNGSLTPGRVADSFATILAVIGSPAPDPKPRGKSPGSTKGKKRTPRTRYPTVKKRVSRTKKASQRSF